MPRPYPREFRDDVVRVARSREPDVTLGEIARDFGVHPATLFKWMRQAEADREAASDRFSRAEQQLEETRKEREAVRRPNAVLTQSLNDRRGPATDRLLTELVDDLRALTAAFDDVRPEDMTTTFYVHAFNQYSTLVRDLLEALDNDT